MHDEDKLHKEVSVGQATETLLQNETLQKAFKELKEL